MDTREYPSFSQHEIEIINIMVILTIDQLNAQILLLQ